MRLTKELMKKIRWLLANKFAPERIRPDKKSFLNKICVEDHLQRYRFAVKYIKDKKILDIACGEGFGSKIMAKSAKKVVGVDLDKEVIKQNIKVLGKEAKFIASDAIKFLKNNKEKFDVIVSFETIEHFKEYQEFVELIYKNLKKNGTLVLSTPNKEVTEVLFGEDYHLYHTQEFYTDELSGILSKVFKNKCKIFRQRPLKENNLFLSTFYEYVIVKESKIVKDSKGITGINNVFVIKK